MNRKKKVAAVAVAAVLACGGTLAGSDSLTTVNTGNDYAQVIATVDLSRSEEIAKGEYKDLVGEVSIVKRDMVASYVASGYSLQQQYNWTYNDVFTAIAESLVNRQVFVQYAKIYLAEHGDAEGNTYTVEGYKAAVGNKTGIEAEVAGLEYFLLGKDTSARDKADYTLKRSLNNAIDSIEEGFVTLEEDAHNHTADSDVRTLPSGAETENADYYTTDYEIYTGRERLGDLGEYEPIEGSTPTTRKKAYARFLANLSANDLITKGENTAEFTGLTYYYMELKSAYETAIINKIAEKFEQEAEAKLKEDWANSEYADLLQSHRDSYTNDTSSFETAFDAISDSSFVLAAPQSRNEETGEMEYDAYGYVMHILLPFSDLQSEVLSEASSDFGDAKGNNFAARTALLQMIRATDQRGTWFTGHNDYSFEAGTGAYKGVNEDPDRQWLFFENSLSEGEEENAKYERLSNYYGMYTYNGTVEKPATEDGEYTITPNKISLEEFLEEMTDYLGTATYDGGKKLEVELNECFENYYAERNYYYTAADEAADSNHKEGEVNYEQFMFAKGRVTAADGTAFNPNNIFVKDSWENTAMSVINELAFAYNTDTASLNSYLGYSISPYKTSFMSEFEYASQWAVKNGAGSVAVVPTDYGWHIIYCTFSFADIDVADGAFTFNYKQKDVEGSFSNLYFETLKSTTVSSYATNMQTEAINLYVDACSEIYTEKFEDLLNLGS